MNKEPMNNKETMINEMTVKVTELQDARDAVEAVIEAIEETASEGSEQVAQLETDIVAKQEALTAITDLGVLRQAQTEIASLQEDVKLVKQVYDNKRKVMFAELENKAEQFFKVHKSALKMFKEMDDYMIVNTSLSEFTDAKAVMSGYAEVLANNFAEIRQVLLDKKIVTEADQNKLFRGYHLGQTKRNTLLLDFEYHIKSYMQQLKRAGLQIK